MPFVGDNIFPQHNQKRRSEEDHGDSGRDTSSRGRMSLSTGTDKQASQTGTPLHLNNHSQPQRKVASTKRARTATNSSKAAADTTPSPSPPCGSNSTPKWTSTSSISPILLLPCHICYRRPLKTTHLDHFTSCQHCGKRACQICIRLCEGGSATTRVGRDDISMRSPPPPPESGILMDDGPDSIDEDVDLMRDDGVVQEGMQKKCCSPMQDVQGLERSVTKHREVICSRCCVEMGADGEVVCFGCLSGMEDM